MVFAVLETEPRITSGTADAETLCIGGEREEISSEKSFDNNDNPLL